MLCSKKQLPKGFILLKYIITYEVWPTVKSVAHTQLQYDLDNVNYLPQGLVLIHIQKKVERKNEYIMNANYLHQWGQSQQYL